MIGKREVAAIALLGCLGLAGCAESTAGSGTRGGAAQTTTPPASQSGSSAPITTNATELGARMKTGNRGVSSLVGTVKVTAPTLNEDVAYTAKSTNGQATAMDMTASVASGGNKVDMRMLWVDGELYLQSNALPMPAGKTWLHASKSSANRQIANLAASMQATAGVTSAEQYARFVLLAKDITVVGNEVVSGVTTTHYRLSIDLTKAIQYASAGQRENFQRARDAGLTDLPLEVWLDSQYRARKITENLTVAGVQIKMVMTAGKFNDPVAIEAPPADQVTEG